MYAAYVSGGKSGNEQVAADIAAWTFQEKNVLRIDRVEHHRVNETAPGETYTTNDQVVSPHAPNCDAHAHAPFC